MRIKVGKVSYFFDILNVGGLMNEKVLPKYSNIYIIDNKRQCKFGGKHDIFQKQIQIYDKNNRVAMESVFECIKCKKLFIMFGNKQRFIDSYPFYGIRREKQDKILTKKQKQQIKEAEARKKKKEERLKRLKIEKEKKEKEKAIEQEKLLARLNDPVEIRKRKILNLIKNNKIRVLDEKHEHKVFRFMCTIGNQQIKLSYCDECNLLYCLKNEYFDYIKEGIPKKMFIYNELEHMDVSMFNKKNIEEEKTVEKKKSIIIEKQVIKNDIKKEIPIANKKTLLVKTDNRVCIFNNHSVKGVTVSIDLLNNNGERITKKIPAFRCEECDITYIYDYQFEELVRKGQPLCLIIDQRIYKQLTKGKRFFYDTDSILTIYGYNVNQNEDLKQSQRQNILRMLINTKIIRKDVAISHLKWLIRQRQNRKNHKTAITRWQEDIDLLTNYDVNYNETYSIDTIINKTRRY